MNKVSRRSNWPTVCGLSSYLMSLVPNVSFFLSLSLLGHIESLQICLLPESFWKFPFKQMVPLKCHHFWTLEIQEDRRQAQRLVFGRNKSSTLTGNVFSNRVWWLEPLSEPCVHQVPALASLPVCYTRAKGIPFHSYHSNPRNGQGILKAGIRTHLQDSLPGTQVMPGLQLRPGCVGGLEVERRACSYSGLRNSQKHISGCQAMALGAKIQQRTTSKRKPISSLKLNGRLNGKSKSVSHTKLQEVVEQLCCRSQVAWFWSIL